MFTVLICDKHIINDLYNKYHIYLKPFLDNENFGFCKWNTSGETLDEAVPDLKNIIRNKKDWRAVIVNDSSTWSFDSVNKRNPFHFVDEVNHKINYRNFEQICQNRELNEANINKALTNPLTKMSIWLCGAPITTKPEVCYNQVIDVIENPAGEKEYFSALNKAGVSAKETEIDRLRLKRYEKLSENFDFGGELFNPPKSVVAICERGKDVSKELSEAAWKIHTEFDYSQFYLDNLYPEKLRYLLYDITYVKKVQDENKYFNFLTFLLILAQNEVPRDALRANRVYKVDIEIDSENIKELCLRYNSKLLATINKINEISLRLDKEEKEPMDNEEAILHFETNVVVPVKVPSSFDTDSMMAEYKEIGLSRDCPGEEFAYWDNQYHEISKLFIRFLREPRRAVKKAACDTFRILNKNDNDKALKLDEFQKEDIMTHLQAEETGMIETTTTHLYNTAKYKKEMEDADKQLRRGISQRMTKKKTIYSSLIAIVAYLLGFLPLFLTGRNTVETFAYSSYLTGIAVLLFTLCGFVFLFVLRKRLVNRFKHFNYVMSGILSDIESSMARFSKYLSHACNVMRSFYVLNYTKNSYAKRRGILYVHKTIVEEKIKEVNELFARYLDDDSKSMQQDAKPYDFDFMKIAEYDYIVPYENSEKEIEFLQEGNAVVIPVDYVKNVSVEREELYD